VWTGSHGCLERSGTGPRCASCAELIPQSAESGNLWHRCTAGKAWKSNQRLAFSLTLHPGRRCSCLMNILIVRSWHRAFGPLSELRGWLLSRASSHTTSNCGCCAPFPTSSSFKLARHLPFNVSIVLRRTSTLLRGSWSVKTRSRI
jgi:hypothetical protein